VNGVNGGDNCFRSMCAVLSVCLYVSVVNQTSLKQLKLRTSNLTCMFPGTVDLDLTLPAGWMSA